ncbi:MAG: hydroxyacid dehydrogenase [Sulfobacillus acidophilus]|uniref:Hydroxyacid dehydrogenase n=1 Tax=Sulfobacillus acidophilus TaxID=53633 RepID=A0A2T2WD90_9FIRM|nr:MAG: hydroxyacid dehydrogenase [Sulfobacillus acidophilus]
MRMRCAVLDDYQNITATTDWSAIRDQVEVLSFQEHFAGMETLVQSVGDCEIIVAMRERTPFPASLFAQLPRLKLLVTTGMRNAAIDLNAAARHQVVVSGTTGSSYATSEQTWALILGLTKHLVQENQALRTHGPWQSTVSIDLQGKTLGLLGLGRIGSQVAIVGKAFGMRVMAWSQNLTQERTQVLGVEKAPSKEHLLRESDIVSIHLVLSQRTQGLIGAHELALMRPSAFLINTSRAAIVDQTALKAALARHTIAGAGLDVFDVEPLSADDEFRSLSNVLATPHLGYVSQDTYHAWFPQIVEDIAAFLAGHPIRVLS